MFRAIVTTFLVLWLPLQGTAAVAMPFCNHPLTDAAHVVPGPEPGHHDGLAPSALAKHEHRAAMVNAASSGRVAPATAHLACNDCGACHLACAPAAPAAGFVFAAPVVLVPQPTDVALLSPF